MSKLPVLIPYLRTPDNGQELRYALRSLKNITNWNGEVFIAGDREAWFSKNINYIRAGRIHYSPQADMENKVITALAHMPDEFIFSNDDCYVVSRRKIRPMHRGNLVGGTKNYYQRGKKLTAEYLKAHGVPEPLDYALHTPMVVSRQERYEVNRIIKPTFKGTPLQARSIYGNLFIDPKEAVYYEDKKTKTDQLKDGAFISTQFYTSELDKLFPIKSKFEI